MTKQGYRRYLRSADFDRRIRQPALRRAGGRCEQCGQPRPRLQVHHNDYYCVGTPDELQQVRAICGGCHLRAGGRLPGGRSSAPRLARAG